MEPATVALPTTPTDRTSTVLRGLAASVVLLSAVLHLQLWVDGMRDVAVVGPAFLLNAAGGVAIGFALLLWRHWLPLLGAIGFGAATFGAYVLSMTVGFFGVREQVWTTAAVLSAVTEVAAVVLGVAAWTVERRQR
ncbi:hypothetical protein [Actinotalea fermentans]|uniref:Uncharacterized protein n=1 Tax=Actinotalea fermentans TaxID=43671 RepID=A0A511YYW7_9CELL|nr:hypothetical protein [Actinotalea fermentans]KGM16109.1 hypothetical protein N867_03155 [Actinotalea fermentans ATCC 43279 = JCM 9966 = DSM 3133]GEN80392.1 hypothetical protein AFE02nite_21260 [Actinotalea fermentans]